MRSYPALLLTTALLLAGCFDVHNSGGPKGSTETGNPPAIDSSLVALVVSKDEVHITGSEGAVTPGGSPLSARNVTSMKLVHGNAAENGSFDLRVDGTRDDVFELRAGSGKTLSEPLFVDRGGAMVGDSDAGALSCKQREDLASTQLTSVIDSADSTCSTDDDCVFASKNTVCLDSCSDVVVSLAGKAEIEAAVDGINGGVCGDYESDGCMFIALPCVPPEPGSPACVKGKCELGPATADNAMSSCDERFQQASDQVDQAIANADRNCMVSGDCALAFHGTACAGSCTRDAVSQAGGAQVDDTVAMINAGLCGNLVEDGCIPKGQVPCPLGPTAVCSGGQCTTLDTLTCGERITAAQLELDRVGNQADKTCAADADCVFAAGSTDCFVGCGGEIVSQQGQAQVATAVDALNSGLCATFIADGCAAPAPSCVAPPEPACNDGTCGAKPTP
jgi:hypothetical protein